MESHKVATEDGYLLTMHRIPYSPLSPAAHNKSVVFLQHGMTASSMDWVIMGPDKSLGEPSYFIIVKYSPQDVFYVLTFYCSYF